MMNTDIERFVKAYKTDFDNAYSEIENGYKQSHWMWYIFPQIKGLGYSEISVYYSINTPEEAKAFLNHPVTGPSFLKICGALLKLDTNDPQAVFGHIDAIKLCSSMTLFDYICPGEKVFSKVLDKYFGGKRDEKSLSILKSMPNEGMPVEIEKKYLIRYPDTELLASQSGVSIANIEQVYVILEDGTKCRIRRWEENGKTTFFDTRKKQITAQKRIEQERIISEEEYDSLLKFADKARHPVVKTRYCIPYNGRELEIDIYPMWNDKAVLEIETESENEEISVPGYLEITDDVTGDERYSNSALALNAETVNEKTNMEKCSALYSVVKVNSSL